MADIVRATSTRPPQEVFRVQELTGRRRDLQLSGSTGPLRPIAFAGEQRRVTTWYAGNPEATRQVLGPKVEPTEAKGMLRARRTFREPAVLVEGSSVRELKTPEDIAEVLESIGREGQDIRVTWARTVRLGTLATWRFEWDRLEDVSYTLTFDWRSRGERLPRANAGPRANGDLSALESAFAAFADAANDINRVYDAVDAKRDAVVFAARRVQAAVSRATALASRSIAVAKLPLDVVNSYAAIATDIRAQVRNVADEVDGPADLLSTQRSVARVVESYTTFHTSASAAERVSREARRQAEARRRDTEPMYLDVVVGRAGQTLEMLARRYYGDADSWQIIADANGLESPVLVGGEVVVIPVRR